MKLPEAFCQRMEKLLGEEYEEFFASYNRERTFGLRYNPLKFPSQEAFEKSVESKMGWKLARVPWCREGYYYQKDDQPGRHPWHEAGAYYIQEPSAMSAAELLGAQPGEKICDLCAAPGGKTTQIAGKMQGKGLLAANEYQEGRARILSQNVERMGIPNAVVLNESPARLAEGFPAFFDRILVDAPCSGEGMFRKDPQAALEWSLENVGQCAGRQHEILDAAAEMLRCGGVLVYSTCTFAPQENEQCIEWFLEKHPEFHLEMAAAQAYFEPGRPEWTDSRNPELKNTCRLWPHKLGGEGHFAARLVKGGEERPPKEKARASAKAKKKDPSLAEFYEFEKNALSVRLEEKLSGTYVWFGDQLYLLPEGTPDLKGYKALRAGLHLGTRKKNRFEPSHALALYLKPDEAKQTAECAEPLKYLHGETVPCENGKKGWLLVCADGLPLGWGKAQNGIVKNHYPKGLRILY